MALRDVVDNCGDGSRSANPVLRMIDAFTGEKAAFHEKWMAQRAQPPMMMEAPPGQFRPQQLRGPRPADMTMDDFQRFEEEEMLQQMHMMNRDDSRFRGPMDPRMLAMMARDPKSMPGMPPMALMEHLSQMERPMGDGDHQAWDAEYERMLQAPPGAAKPDDAMFAMMEREFGRTAIRPGPAGPLPGPQLIRGPAPRDWAAEFDQESKFAEFERVYPGDPGGRGAEALPEAWVKDFEEEYGEMMSSSTQSGEGASAELDLKVTKDNQRTASQIAAITDPKFRQSELFKMMSALSNGEIAFQGDKVVPLPAETRDAMDRAGPAATRSEDWINDFEREVSRGEDLARPGGVWQREFESFAPQSADDELKDPWGREMDEFDRKFGAAWAESMRAGVPPLGEEEEALPNNIDALNFDEHVSTDYQFVENNSFLDDDGAFERGRELFNAGRLTESIEALEAAVKQKPEHSAAWQLLGAAQAENDRDDLASVALLKAIQADPDNRDALITLSVSYVNDFRKHRALECLQQWLSTSPHYQSIDTSVQLGQNFERNHEIITDMFIQAARMRPEDPDADVQIALGLLFNLTFDYDRAIDCFKAAAMKRPDDYLVWNKLGATQANAKQSQEAIDAFVRALEIKPSYTRACSNLGISFMALNEYGEAAKAFLSALALNPNALHQWDNLRNVFSLMRRADLLKKCDTKDISLFAEEFNF